MNKPDYIKTLKGESKFKFKEKASEFMGIAKPFEKEEEAIAFLHQVKKHYYDANHHCYAYNIMPGLFKYSDDGEPNGTAGIRIYNALQHFELINLVVIVVRYFGGTKLGAGPLGKAYYKAAYGALDSSSIIKKDNYIKAEVFFDYAFTSNAHHFLGFYNAKILDTLFDERPSIRFLIKPVYYESLGQDLSNASKGKAELKVLDKSLFV